VNSFVADAGHFVKVEIGIGYVEEVYARLQGHVYNLPPGATQSNVTTSSMQSTFPLNQTLYFDFSHDTNIMAIITAFGLKQFAQELPASGPPADQQLIVSHVTPFAARMVRRSREASCGLTNRLNCETGLGNHQGPQSSESGATNQRQCDNIRLL